MLAISEPYFLTSSHCLPPVDDQILSQVPFSLLKTSFHPISEACCIGLILSRAKPRLRAPTPYMAANPACPYWYA